MSSFKQRTLDFLEIEWKTYIERFDRWPADEGLKRVNAQGYQQFRDMLAHVLAWWEEGMEIILATAEGREFARKKYDFDAFNAEAVARLKAESEVRELRAALGRLQGEVETIINTEPHEDVCLIGRGGDCTCWQARLERALDGDK